MAGAGVATVLLADDRMLIRAGLRAVIESDPSLRVVAEASDGPAALELARRLEPSIALLPARTRDVDGIAVTRELRAGCPDTAVLILAAEADGDLLLEGLRAGAIGFCGHRRQPGRAPADDPSSAGR
jgi:DNA-binding NarL/FixJ family response regulator